MKVTKWGGASALTLIFAFAACTPAGDAEQEIRYLVGVSQANLTEPWRIVMNQELREEAQRHPEMRLIVTDASDSSLRQIGDIRQLQSLGVDLLIVSPNDATTLAPTIAKAYRQIPVILLDRAVEGYDYSLFIGPDNRRIGEQAGKFVAGLLDNGSLKSQRDSRVLLIQGSQGSPPVNARSEGFRSVLASRSGLQVTSVLEASWSRDRAEDGVRGMLARQAPPDIIFAHNDHMALGAWRALAPADRKGITLIGVDGLAGQDGGIDLVERAVLQATITCPTGGREAIVYALDLLNKQEGIPKKIFLRTHLVTRDSIGSSPEPVATTQRPGGADVERKIVLGFSQPGHESDWRLANAESIKTAAARAGIKLIMTDADQSQSRQIADIRSFIARKVDVIAFSPLVSTGYTEVLQEAQAAGIPVICSDRQVDDDDSLFSTFIGADFYEEGTRAAQWLVERLKGRPAANIVELQGTIGSAPARDREAGFQAVIDRSPGLSVTVRQSGDFKRSEGKRLMTGILATASQSIDVVFAHNDDMALGAIEAMREAGLRPGKDILVVSIDGVRAAFRAMQEGTLNCTVECNPLLGPQLIKAVRDYMDGKELPLRIITEESVFPAETAAGLFAKRKY